MFTGRQFLLALSLAISGATATPVAQPDGAPLTALVDPFIGTGGHGHTYPGPSLPFGMIQPGPDTRLTGWDGCSGYHYSDSRIYGFSHTHLSGTGIPDYADVLLAPTTGEVRLNNGADGTPGYSSAFTHEEETASPGYYAVSLKDYAVRAELTATTRVALHRYGFPAGRPSHVILDLTHRDQLTDAAIDIASDTEVTGLRRSTGWARDQVVYFVIRFSRPFEKSAREGLTHSTGEQGLTDSAGEQGLTHSAGEQGLSHVRSFDFGTAGGPLLVKVGISAVSVEGARKNLETEMPGWDFDAVRADASRAWERELSTITVEGGTRDNRVRFYTALYHAMLTPNVFMDVDGSYRGLDGKTHTAQGFTYYTVFSLWDTFRALHPLLTLVDRARTRDFVQTFLRQYEQDGRLPVWELAANETDTMIGYHAVPVIADAIAKDIDGFDRDLAFEAMKRSADEDRFGLASYRRNGFIDARDEAESVSRTLEYAYDDWTIAQVARRIGRPDDYRRFLQRAQSFKHLFDPSTGFMRARVGGFWSAPFDPAEVNNHYTEANAWQYSFFVPQDVEGLMRLMGGPEAFVRKLDTLFTTSSQTTGREQADITGLIGQYAHGNEPSHHMAYLYAYAGQPWKTQAMVRRILDTMYGSGPDGLSGNEDCGQMSAWYVMSALGLYSVAPGSNEYVIGSPLFERATVRLENGRTFIISAKGNTSDSVYIQRATLNGVPYGKSYIDYAAVARGGELVFQMGTAPAAWGSDAAARPHSSIDEHPVVPVPFVASGAPVFRGTQQVAFGDADATAKVTATATLKGRPTTDAGRGFSLNVSGTFHLTATRDSVTSPELSVTFRRLPDYPRIALSAAYAPQYAAGGDDALIDGIRGGDNFRVGTWQGYSGRDLDVTLDFGQPRDVREVSMGFLQDTGAWIFMPRRIAVLASNDGETFSPLGEAASAISERESKPVTRDFTVTASTRARYVRIHVEHYGNLPPWHPGSGGDAWFFADEILVR